MTEIARGLEGVVLTETRLSMVDGQAGRLIIGGFPLVELAHNATFEETLFLLWNDRLPGAEELRLFGEELDRNRELPQITWTVLEAAAGRELPPMAALRMAVDTLALDDPAPDDNSRQANLNRAHQLVAKVPTIVAGYWRLLTGDKPLDPAQGLGLAANFLYMLHGEEAHAASVRGLETYMNSVVDHGMNASTFTARVIVSTRSDMISAVVGAIGALKGPLHGGAPGPALDTVFELRELASKSGEPLKDVAERWARETIQGGGRIMGFGHRVYKVRDPRADVLGEAARRLFDRTGDADLYRDATMVENVFLDALEELKPGRGLKTNVEFYTALVLHGLGLESPIFSSIFAMARMGGWTAHILEQLDDNILIRPRSLYSGPADRTWTPVSER